MHANFECSFRSGTIAAAGTLNIIFTTGSRPAVFFARTVGFSGAGASAVVFEGPTGVVAGTPVIAYPMDLVTDGTAQGVMTQGGTVSGTGTQKAAKTFYRGSVGVGTTVIGTYGAANGNRRLKPYTTYLLQFTNDDTGPQTFDLYFRWYEGVLEYPMGV